MSLWFRWYEGTTEDGKFRVIARNASVTVRDVIALWAFILEDASSDKHRGICVRNEDFMASVLDFEDGQVEKILEEMENLELISVGHGAISVCNWGKRQFETDKIDGTNAERQRRFRERHRETKTKRNRNDHVTAEKRPDTDTDTDTEKKDIRAVAIATRPASNKDFEEFLKSYPRRQGANPKHPARKKFEAHVKSGVSPETIIAAARAYEAEQRKLGNIGTPYIAQAVTWLNQQRFEDYTQKNGTGPPAGLTPEQQAKWVRDQLEAERATNETANHSSGILLERSEEIRGSPSESERRTGMVFDFPRNAEAH